jgi:N6-L-threonylcarbamoyladenine synthase
MILAVETSCDDTSAAVVHGRDILSSVVSSQNELHAQFGGVVPEVASRRHTELIDEVVAEAMSGAGIAWADLEAVAVTRGPGLIGALLVGVAAAKAYAHRHRLPLIPVNHLQGHIAANYALGIEPPFLCLLASGGHTLLAAVDEGVEYRVASRTLDDAAGEAFDKGARLLGLGYPGGKELDMLAAQGDPGWTAFPRAVPHGGDFSFSGLKTALLYDLRERSSAEIEAHRADIAASYQAAIVRQLVEKTVAAAAAEGVRSVAVAGGVAANSGLRRALAQRCEAEGLDLTLPPFSLCTDNAGMIGLAAGFLPALPWPDYLALDAFASDVAARPPKRAVRQPKQG